MGANSLVAICPFQLQLILLLTHVLAEQLLGSGEPPMVQHEVVALAVGLYGKLPMYGLLPRRWLLA